MQLVIESVGHAYDGLQVLDNISFTVAEDEVVAVLGPSGCGKSTLLGIVGGLIEPVAGQVLLRGVPSAQCLNPMTYIFQDFALLPWRTVAGNVGLALEHHSLDKNERDARIADVLRRTRLSDFAHAYPRQLSGGMRQRVAIARALVVNPAVLLLDEPLSALDAQTRDLLMDDFIELWMRERVSAVYVTHNLNEALRLADRIVVLSRRPGRIWKIIPIRIPRPERKSAAAQLELAEIQDSIWDLIKAEAEQAERELVND
jgi:NitT/TauT family transport system ATP-binding protein